jgi:predicted nucleotidyltransferase
MRHIIYVLANEYRGADLPESDIDLIVKYSDKSSGTLFDYADIKDNLEKILNGKIDLAEEDFIAPFAWKIIKKDLKVIYG